MLEKERNSVNAILLTQTVHVHLDVCRAALCGTAHLTLSLRTFSLCPEVRVNCAPTCRIHRCFLDNKPACARRSLIDLGDSVVPARWRSTQDLPSYQQCHGPTTSAQCFQAPGALQMSFHGGELILYLPASSPSRVETKMAGSTLLASKERCGHGHSFADGFTRDQDCVALLIEYSVPYPRGGLHFARVLPGSPPHCVHTIEQGAAARRWMPCVDCVQVLARACTALPPLFALHALPGLLFCRLAARGTSISRQSPPSKFTRVGMPLDIARLRIAAASMTAVSLVESLRRAQICPPGASSSPVQRLRQKLDLLWGG